MWMGTSTMSFARDTCDAGHTAMLCMVYISNCSLQCGHTALSWRLIWMKGRTKSRNLNITLWSDLLVMLSNALLYLVGNMLM